MTIMNTDIMSHFWLRMNAAERGALAALCTTMCKLRTPTEHAKLVSKILEPDTRFVGFVGGTDILLLPVVRFVNENPDADFTAVFTHLSEL